MPSLDWGSIRPLELVPASRFPRRADGYVCERSRRDLTKPFPPSRGHTWSPTAPERFNRPGGKTYLTGTSEWDHPEQSERSQRFPETLGIGMVVSAISSLLALVAYLLLPLAFRLGRAGVIAATSITCLPFIVVPITFWPSVVQSTLRTRFRCDD